ncbi:hypothetical protein J3Q64DRAFT_1852704 [Phycomyces blakesleeanus]|uniref:Uncharacterized protein n=1 Tax=Phycomyces blakesleeanus TaxID=4837 RepID=A0ABR3AM25_PHYBL
MDNLQGIVQQANLATLLGVHLGLSLFGALASNPTYNIPIFFFGIWAFNYHESNTPIKTFTGALGLSIFLDVIWFILHGGNPGGESGFGFAMTMNIISLLVKPVSVFAAVNTIQNRGDTLNAGNWAEAPGAFPGSYQPVRDGEEYV